jgi:hypothetical protein
LCVVVAAAVFYVWGLRSGWTTPALEALGAAHWGSAPARGDAEPARVFEN